eukprot:TRINITY_DN3524_c0_g1_i1.p4 TRINITY_DN3524_c0_g1~~TRINITY_DN3524_c0_g1_i1.p4  ORF type:complete len:119 (-),score=42.49 TRINITY_DN3524_c0_g1_i1:27-362(-)
MAVEPGAVSTPRTVDEFNKIIASAGAKLVIVAFVAPWCGACKSFGPTLARVAKQYPGIVFATVDIDELKALGEAKTVAEVPLFRFFRKGVSLNQFSGANETRLKEAIEKFK